MRKALLAATTLILGVGVAAAPAANIEWIGAGDGTTWNDADNWRDRDTLDPSGVPTSADNIHLNGATVGVYAAATYNNFISGSGGWIDVNSGGVLTPTGSAHATLRHASGINVNAGGQMAAPTTSWIRCTVNIADGGAMTGTREIRDGRTLTVGGTWKPMDSVDGNNNFMLGASTVNGSVSLLSTGIIELDLYGDGVNEHFEFIRGGSSLSLADGIVNLVLQGGYLPQIGDSYTIWTNNTAGSTDPRDDDQLNLNLGDGSNFVLTGFLLDTSNLSTTGVITVIPEPAGMALLGIGGLLGLRRRRR